MQCHLVGFRGKKKKKQTECVVCSAVVQQKYSQSVLQLLVEQKVNRKASFSSRQFPSTFWERIHDLWVPCHRTVPAVAQVNQEPGSSSLCFKQEILEMAWFVRIFASMQHYCLLGCLQVCLTSCICVRLNFENPEWFSCISFVKERNNFPLSSVSCSFCPHLWAHIYKKEAM